VQNCTSARAEASEMFLECLVISPDCVFDASLVPGTCLGRFRDMKGLINKFLELLDIWYSPSLVIALIKNSPTAPPEPASAVIDVDQFLLCSFEQIFVLPWMYSYRAVERAFFL